MKTQPFFDWYQATVEDSPEGVQKVLESAYPEGDIRPSKPHNGAAAAFQLIIGEAVVATAIYGGAMGDGLVNIRSTGCDAKRFAEVIRERYPVHRVTRADVALDFDGEGAWEHFKNWGIELATKFGLKTSVEGDWVQGIGGRTLYIGSRSSAAFMRIYEKGKQCPDAGLPNWVRVELEIKPPKAEGKQAICQVKPIDLYRCSRWSLAAGKYLASEETFERIVIGTRWNKSSIERALSYMVKQYGAILGEWCSHLGGWPEVGVDIGQRLLLASQETQRLKEVLSSVRRADHPHERPQVAAIVGDRGFTPEEVEQQQ